MKWYGIVIYRLHKLLHNQLSVSHRYSPGAYNGSDQLTYLPFREVVCDNPDRMRLLWCHLGGSGHKRRHSQDVLRDCSSSIQGSL